MGVPGWVYQGGYTGAGRVGIPGEYYPATLLGEPRTTPAKRAPEAHRAGVGGCGAGRAYWASWGRRRGRPCTHPAGPVGPPRGPPWYRTSRIAASWPIWARIDLISWKLSQNEQVSPETTKRPVIVPICKTGSGIHLLIFSDFSFR